MSSFAGKEFLRNDPSIGSFEPGAGANKFRTKIERQNLGEKGKSTGKLTKESSSVAADDTNDKSPFFPSKKVLRNVGFLAGPPLFLSLSLLLTSCKEESVVEEQVEEGTEQGEIKDGKVVIPSEVKETTKETKELASETTVETEKVDAPEIPGLTFNQETKSYFNEKGVEVGVWIEDAVKIDEEIKQAIALKPEAINKILNENKEKGIFKCPWPFDFQKDKGIEIVELFYNPLYKQKIFEKIGLYDPAPVGIRYTESVNLYAPFDVNNENVKVVNELIPKDEKDPDFFSAQPQKIIIISTEFSYKSEETEPQGYGSIQFGFIDWKPTISLREPYKLGDVAYSQDIIGKIETGDFLGELLPSISDFEFFDTSDNPEIYKNFGRFQSRLIVTNFQDDYSQSTSSLEKMLNYKNRSGQEIPVCIWPEKNTVHEQTN